MIPISNRTSSFRLRYRAICEGTWNEGIPFWRLVLRNLRSRSCGSENVVLGLMAAARACLKARGGCRAAACDLSVSGPCRCHV